MNETYSDYENFELDKIDSIDLGEHFYNYTEDAYYPNAYIGNTGNFTRIPKTIVFNSYFLENSVKFINFAKFFKNISKF